MNIEQQTLYHWFAEGVVKNMLGTKVGTSTYIRPDYFFVIDEHGKESRSVWNEGLTQSIQKYISSPVLIMEEQKLEEENKKYIILIQDKQDRYGILLSTSNGYQFVCVKGLFNERFTFDTLLNKGAVQLVEDVVEDVKESIADHPSYRLYAATGVLEFDEFEA